MRRLLVVFALLGVVGTAAAFRGGALPGPDGVSFGTVSTYFCKLTGGNGCTMTGVVDSPGLTNSTTATQCGVSSGTWAYGQGCVTDSSGVLIMGASFGLQVNNAVWTSVDAVSGVTRGLTLAATTLSLNATGGASTSVSFTAPIYKTTTNCAVAGATPACTAAPAGHSTIVDGASSVTISTTAFTTNSEVVCAFSTYTPIAATTCNTNFQNCWISAQSATAITCTCAADPAGTDPICITWSGNSN